VSHALMGTGEALEIAAEYIDSNRSIVREAER
jgi:hypothetical protein